MGEQEKGRPSRWMLAAESYAVLALAAMGGSWLAAAPGSGAELSLPELALGCVLLLGAAWLAWRVARALRERLRARADGPRPGEPPLRDGKSRQMVLSGAFEGLPIGRSGRLAYIRTEDLDWAYLDRRLVEGLLVLQEEQVRGAPVSVLRIVADCLIFGHLSLIPTFAVLVLARNVMHVAVMVTLIIVPFLIGAVLGTEPLPLRRVYTVELRLRGGEGCVAEVDEATLRALEDPAEGPAGGAGWGGPRWGAGHGPGYDQGGWGVGHGPEGGESRWDCDGPDDGDGPEDGPRYGGRRGGWDGAQYDAGPWEDSGGADWDGGDGGDSDGGDDGDDGDDSGSDD